MWVWRQTCEDKVVALAEARALLAAEKEKCWSVTKELAQVSKALVNAKLRIHVLEASVLEYNDKLVGANKQAIHVNQPITLDDIFEEDDQAVQRDRERVMSEGTSDPLLSEMDS